MLVFVDANIVLFAVPKTGSTAYHMALRGKADISLANKAGLKHMTARKYDRDFGPYLAQAHGLTPERVAVMRDPLEQLRSWYRYRQDPKRKGAGNSAAGLSFDDFVLAADQFGELCKADIWTRLLFGVSKGVTEAEIDRVVDGAVETFMARYGTKDGE